METDLLTPHMVLFLSTLLMVEGGLCVLCVGCLPYSLSPCWTPAHPSHLSTKYHCLRDACDNQVGWVWFPCLLKHIFHCHLLWSLVHWSGLILSYESWMCTSLPSSMFNDITIVAWNQSWWEFFHQRNGQMLQIRVRSAPFPQRAGVKTFTSIQWTWGVVKPLFSTKL